MAPGATLPSPAQTATLHTTASSPHAAHPQRKACYILPKVLKIRRLQLKLLDIADSVSKRHHIIPVSIVEDYVVLLEAVQEIPILLEGPAQRYAVLGCYLV